MAKEKLTNEQMELLFDTMEKIDSNKISLQDGIKKLLKDIGEDIYIAKQLINFSIIHLKI